MRLIARYLIQEENVPRENILYLNFEDDRFAEFKTPDFQSTRPISKSNPRRAASISF